MNDHSRIATEFEHNFFLSGAAFDLPSHRSAAGKADELDAIVGDQQARVFVRERKNVECTVRQARLLNRFGEKEGGEWGLRGRLQNHRAPGGNRWRNFVGHEVERKIKRG